MTHESLRRYFICNRGRLPQALYNVGYAVETIINAAMMLRGFEFKKQKLFRIKERALCIVGGESVFLML